MVINFLSKGLDEFCLIRARYPMTLTMFVKCFYYHLKVTSYWAQFFFQSQFKLIKCLPHQKMQIREITPSCHICFILIIVNNVPGPNINNAFDIRFIHVWFFDALTDYLPSISAKLLKRAKLCLYSESNVSHTPEEAALVTRVAVKVCTRK